MLYGLPRLRLETAHHVNQFGGGRHGIVDPQTTTIVVEFYDCLSNGYIDIDDTLDLIMSPNGIRYYLLLQGCSLCTRSGEGKE